MKINPTLSVDFYKTGHRHMYPKGITEMYSNLTPRNSKHFTLKSSMFDNKVVVFGVQTMLMNLKQLWDDNFFSQPIKSITAEYKAVMLASLGIQDADTSHWEALHKLGHLPIKIKALPEGTRSPIGVPVLTITNTNDDFAWLVNYLETYIAASLWKPITMATNSYEYKRVLTKFNRLTADTQDFMPWQVHDFSARGLGSPYEWSTNSIAHLTSFSGTDTVQAILGAQHYYDADLSCGGSVPATEHSVMTISISDIGGDKLAAEKQYLNKLLTELYPTGIISVVCDSYDFWGVIEYNLPGLKDTILTRDGKLVIRPDSGTPIDVICGIQTEADKAIQYAPEIDDFDTWKSCVAEYIGDAFKEDLDTEDPIYTMKKTLKFGDTVYNVIYTPDLNRYDKTYYYVDNYSSTLSYCTFNEVIPAEKTTEQKGLLQVLWEIFGGTINDKGYKVLDPHIGTIYGDAITPNVYEDVLFRMKEMGFSSDNLVIGAGAVGNQLITRDTFGFAIKATHAIVNGNPVEVSKDPKTDHSKKSAKGLLQVTKDLSLVDCCTPQEEELGELVTVFKDSELVNTTTLEAIRLRLS